MFNYQAIRNYTYTEMECAPLRKGAIWKTNEINKYLQNLGEQMEERRARVVGDNESGWQSAKAITAEHFIGKPIGGESRAITSACNERWWVNNGIK